MQTKQIGLIVALMVGLRLFYFGLSNVADKFLPYAPTFAYAYDKLPSYGLPRWLYSWSNFDGVHYLTIAEKGYFGTGLIQAFFPLYPAAIWCLNLLFDNTLIASLVVSNIASVFAFVWMYFLFKKMTNKSVAWMGIISALLFPTAFYFFAAYGESLFLVFLIGAFWFLEKKQWFLMSLCIAGASATRIVGIFLVPAIAFEVFTQNQYAFPSLQKFFSTLRKQSKPLSFTLLGCLGLAMYMIYLWRVFDDPLYFWHVQEEFGGGRQESIVLLPQTVWRYVKIVMTVPFDLRMVTYVQEFFFGVVPLLIILLAWLKYKVLKHSWAVFSLLALLLPSMTGTFSSMPRYALTAIPLYLLLGIAYNRYPKLRWGLAVSTVVLLVNSLLFVQGYWIA